MSTCSHRQAHVGEGQMGLIYGWPKDVFGSLRLSNLKDLLNLGISGGVLIWPVGLETPKKHLFEGACFAPPPPPHVAPSVPGSFCHVGQTPLWFQKCTNCCATRCHSIDFLDNFRYSCFVDCRCQKRPRRGC